ncbi:hypothetical protein K501DRAFT_280991 [Backusella circina FSU 941]|nr:hypothetical protein K501DRAFT_280991 [Backusella circina FSU 941]
MARIRKIVPSRIAILARKTMLEDTLILSESSSSNIDLTDNYQNELLSVTIKKKNCFENKDSSTSEDEGNSNLHEEMVEEVRKQLPIGREFDDIDALRDCVIDFREKYNCPMTTATSKQNRQTAKKGGPNEFDKIMTMSVEGGASNVIRKSDNITFDSET